MQQCTPVTCLIKISGSGIIATKGISILIPGFNFQNLQNSECIDLGQVFLLLYHTVS